MEYILYYLLGIVIAFILIAIGLIINGNEYEDDTVGIVLAASVCFPITITIIIGTTICFLIDKLFKLILK